MSMNPRTLRPSSTFTPRSISGLALWLDASSSDLYTTDAGPVVAVASPLDIAGCVGWWDSSDLSAMRQNSDGTGAVAAGDPVGWWLDKSATGATVTGSGSARPTLSATGFNSKQALVFNGSSTNLSRAAYTATNSLSGMTRIAVCSNTNQLAFMSRVYDGGGDTFMLMNASWRTYSASGANFSSATIPGAVGSSAPAGVYADVFASSAMSMYALGASLPVTVNGTIAATTAAGSPALHIGSNIGANGFWNGPIAEYIIYNRALTRAELARVEAYLAQRWSISGVHAPATASSDPVGYWGDRSGNGRHAVQATAGSRPLVGTLNGRKAVTFDGTNDNLFVEDYSVDNSLPGMTRFIAFDSDATASMIFATTSTSAKTANAGGGIWWQRFGSNWYGYSADAVRYHGGTADESPHIATNFFDGTLAASFGTRLQNYIDGALLPVVGSQGTLGTTTGASGAKLSIGSNLGINNFVNGKILEVLSYNRALTTAERQRAERYLAAKWGITLAPQVANADAQNWIDRVYANGGTVSSATAAAVNTFCDAIDSASIRDRFYRLNLFCGSFQGAFVPLFRGPSLGGTQYGGATDTNLGSPAFLVGDYNEASGLQGNGSSKYLNTGVPMNFSNLRDYHLSSYVSSITSGNSGLIGADTLGDGVSPRFFQALVSFASATRIWVWYNYGNTGNQSDNSSNSYAPGLLTGVGSQTANNLYSGASSVASSAVQADQTGNRTLPVFVFAYNLNGSASNYANARLGGYSLGRTMTATQVGHYNTALAAFNAAMGRT